jgi:hypothetical protein
MKFWNLVLVFGLVAGVLAGCGGDADISAQEEANDALAESGEGDTYSSSILSTAYDQALPISSQLALGIYRLEETDDAVTPEQARTLLPLWQALQSESLQGEAETNAVLKQIEGALASDQLSAIADMQLTLESLGAWMQEHGVNLGPSPEEMATRQAAGGGQAGPFGDLSEEERASMRATRQAGGESGFGPGSGLGEMSEEDRAAMRATAEASGMGFPGGGRGPGARGQLSMLAELVIELLTERAAE